MLLQSLRALCLAAGGPGSIWKYLEALVRTTRVSGRFACGFQTDLHFADAGAPSFVVGASRLVAGDSRLVTGASSFSPDYHRSSYVYPDFSPVLPGVSEGYCIGPVNSGI